MLRFACHSSGKRAVLLLAALVASSSVSLAAAFEPPAWAGEPGTEFSEWDVFTSGFGEPGNAPDIVGSTGDALLRQVTPGGIVTGTGNLYNPAGGASFTITDSFPQPPEIVVFEATVSGTQVNVDSVKLEFTDRGNAVSLRTVGEELARVSGGFGDTVTSRWTWDLRGRSADELVIKLSARGPHCSLTAARLDVRYKPDASEFAQTEPSMDRWNYPFNSTPGTRAVASTFRSSAAAGLTRYAMLITGFDTSGEIAPGRGGAAYEIVSAKVTLMTSSNFEVVYDPTADAAFTYLTNGHPQFVADADPGRPLELFGAGFRNGYTPLTWIETAPYAPTGGDRTVYPVTWSDQAAEVDASTNINYAAPYEAAPFASGGIAGATAGQNVPHETPVVFEIDVTQPGVRAYLQAGLDIGRVFFTATSLHSGGQGVRTFPEYYTRDSLIGDAPKFELTVRLYDREEVVTVSAITSAPAGRTLRFPALDGASYGVRWSTDLKNWQLVREPALTTPEAGDAEWVDDSAAGAMKFYQVYLKP